MSTKSIVAQRLEVSQQIENVRRLADGYADYGDRLAENSLRQTLDNLVKKERELKAISFPFSNCI